METRLEKFANSDLSATPKWRLVLYFTIVVCGLAAAIIFSSIQHPEIEIWRHLLAFTIGVSGFTGIFVILHYSIKRKDITNKYLPIISRILTAIVALQMIVFVVKLIVKKAF